MEGHSGLHPVLTMSSLHVVAGVYIAEPRQVELFWETLRPKTRLSSRVSTCFLHYTGLAT